MPSLRAYAFACQYLLNDAAEVIVAAPLWIVAGFGTRLEGSKSRRRYQRVAEWSIAVMERRAKQLLGMYVEVDGDDLSGLAPAPAIVLCRHASVLDASLSAIDGAAAAVTAEGFGEVLAHVAGPRVGDIGLGSDVDRAEMARPGGHCPLGHCLRE